MNENQNSDSDDPDFIASIEDDSSSDSCQHCNEDLLENSDENILRVSKKKVNSQYPKKLKKRKTILVEEKSEGTLNTCSSPNRSEEKKKEDALWKNFLYDAGNDLSM